MSLCNERRDLGTSLGKQKKKKVSLTKTVEDTYNGNTAEIENPEIYAPREGSHNGFNVRIPDSVQGIDRRICQLIRGRITQDEIARRLGLKRSDVENRLRRLRARHNPESMAAPKKAAKKATKGDKGTA